MANGIFDIIILNGRPAAGKSEILDFLKKVPLNERIERFHVGVMEEIDDFPILWERFEDDEIYSRHGKPRLISRANFTYQGQTYEGSVFQDKFFWNFLVEKLNLAYAKKLRDDKHHHNTVTTLLEFSRGAEHGGFKEAYGYLADEILQRAVTLYIKVSWEESLRKNRRRYNPGRPDSILQHALEDKKLEMLYQESDWAQFAADPRYLQAKSFQVPYAVFDNEPELTDRPEKIEPLLARLLGQLWRIKQARRD